MEKNRRDVEERAEQLKSIGNMAALVAGFAVVAFLEFSADTDRRALKIMFGLTTALVVRFPAAQPPRLCACVPNFGIRHQAVQ